MKIDTAQWVRQLMEAHGIQVIQWPDNSVGLLNVPAKWCAVISDLSNGLACLSEGEPLPKLRARIVRPKRSR